MKNIKEVKLGFDCPEKWSNMKGDLACRSCSTCDRKVYNFSVLNDQEIIKFLSRNTINDRVCVKINRHQFDSINRNLKLNNQGRSFIKPILFAASLTILVACKTNKNTNNSYEYNRRSKVEIISDILNKDSLQTVLVKGQVFDDQQIQLIGVKVVVKDSEKVCVTNIDGEFEFMYPLAKVKDRTILVKYTGFKELQIPLIKAKNKKIRVEMIEEELLGEIVIEENNQKSFWFRIKAFLGR